MEKLYRDLTLMAVLYAIELGDNLSSRDDISRHF
jgi:hypothetical protein